MSGRYALAFSLFTIFAIGGAHAACGMRATSTGDAGVGMDSGLAADGGADAPDDVLDASAIDDRDGGTDAGATCTLDALGLGYFGEWASPVAGTIRGQHVDGVVCQGGTGAYVQQIVPQGAQQQDYTLFFLETPIAPDGSHPQVLQFTTPADLTSAWISIRIGLAPLYGPPVPGTYTEVNSSCGNFDLYLKIGSSTPPAYDIAYGAAGAHDCGSQEAQTPIGSWALQITSADGWEADGGPGSYYVVHGSLSADLQGYPVDAGTAALSFTF